MLWAHARNGEEWLTDQMRLEVEDAVAALWVARNFWANARNSNFCSICSSSSDWQMGVSGPHVSSNALAGTRFPEPDVTKVGDEP